MKAEPVIPGIATGRVLRSARPLSFWGGVDAATGRITDIESPPPGALVPPKAQKLASSQR